MMVIQGNATGVTVVSAICSNTVSESVSEYLRRVPGTGWSVVVYVATPLTGTALLYNMDIYLRTLICRCNRKILVIRYGEMGHAMEFLLAGRCERAFHDFRRQSQ